MANRPDSSELRIGAVSYLNSRPLIQDLGQLAPAARVTIDLPSRLADDLVAGRLDVGLLPSIEYFRIRGCTIVSDACIACRGPVRSVKLYCRVPIARVKSLALDIGSRTSAALTRILLCEQFGIAPQVTLLPIGAAANETAADAVLLIGDRGMLPPDERFAVVWDLGEEWYRWAGLPFVFAMWIARPQVSLNGISRILGEARDRGAARVAEIARQAAPELGLPEFDCLAYLRDNLAFHFGPGEREGLSLFYKLAVKHRLAPSGVDLVFDAAHVAR
jgi:chorismate dehydratase